MVKAKSKYSCDDKKYIVQSIENLKNNEDYVAIFEIFMEDQSTEYSQNSNGVFLNLSSASDRTLDKIVDYLKRISKKQQKEIEINTDVIPNINNQKSSRTYKLSNYEKSILKQRDVKKILNDDNHKYEKLQFDKHLSKSDKKAKSFKSKNKTKKKSSGKITKNNTKSRSKKSTKLSMDDRY